MILLALAAALLQAPDTAVIYDTPATRALVERAIAASAEVPAELRDYRAEVHTSMFTALAPDSLAGGDLPASVDETVSEVRWSRTGALHQQVLGHRTRLLIPLPYTLATVLERPWVIPHLYGAELYTPFAGPRAVNPFGRQGPLHYRYSAEDTVRIRVQDEQVTLVPVTVRPRLDASRTDRLLVTGTFYLDVQRDAVARARFGFVGDPGVLPRSVGRLDTYLELENALWRGRYWLPFRQRREVVFGSRVLGGSVAARVINRFVEFELNTGWEPEGERVRLGWSLREGAFAGWRATVGAEAGEYSTEDFADLRVATAAAARPARTGPALELHYERGNHLFRFNRVEGPFVGVGARLIPPDPREDRWQLYGTAGWAFAEGTARGEVGAVWGEAAVPRAAPGTDWGAQAAVYRRLRDIQAFRPTYGWDLLLYTLPALFWGSDERDYYDATGAELFGTFRRGRWRGRLGGRVERHDSVQVNTGRFLFGEAEAFGPLAGIDEGTLTAAEGSLGYALGPGAFGIGNSFITWLDARAGMGDFQYGRLSGLVSARYGLGPLTIAARADAGHAWGGVPPQDLFRFGATEGLRGYEPNEFGGSTALLTRARLLVGIPPRSAQPLARFDFLLIPPLRPALVLLAESGWTRVDEELRDELLRLRARPTDGVRSSVGVGISLFEDAFTIERLWPVGADADRRDGRWYVGLTYWY